MPELSVFYQKFEKFRQNYPTTVIFAYFISYSSRSIDINDSYMYEPKSYQYGSKVSLGTHILTQFDEIYRLVYELTEYG